VVDTDTCVAGSNCAGAVCDDELGAGVVHPLGQGSSNVDCGLAQGRRYLTRDDDLTAGFQCIAQVGIGGDGTERPMEAMMRAVSDGSRAPGSCNEGFLRDDAILVVTIVSDAVPATAPELSVLGPLDTWRSALVDAKGGDASAIVVLGIAAISRPGLVCEGVGQVLDAPQRFYDFVGSWGDHGILGGACDPSYTDFFAEAVAIIDTTCDDFVPPG
jgi:hypothetical protein